MNMYEDKIFEQKFNDVCEELDTTDEFGYREFIDYLYGSKKFSKNPTVIHTTGTRTQKEQTLKSKS